MDITVRIDERVLKVKKGQLLSELLALHSVDTDMPCGGHGKCGKCRVFARGDVSEPTEKEIKLLGDQALKNGVRLACLTRAEGDCFVVTSKKTESRILTDGDMPEFQLDLTFLKYGVAIDVGTTTIASRLFDTRGKLLAEAVETNPQSSFGADVISRMESALKGNAKTISEITLKVIDSLIESLAESANIEAKEIDGVVLTGNTVMLHFITGTDVEPLTHAPFEAKRLFGETLKAKDIPLKSLESETEIFFPSCIAAFLGADTSNAILAASLSSSSRNELLCDIGTNGEIVLSKGGKLFACSTAAGPAFEGADISMGMAGKLGAVDHVSCKGGVLDAHVIGDVSPIGICGSGIIDAVSCLLKLGVLDETGRLDGEHAVIIGNVLLTQEDIRKVQLAKSAIHAGIRTLLITSGTDISTIDTLFIAGGFGNYLDTDNAIGIGLLPRELEGKIRVIGNAALTGASMLLLSRSLRATAEQMIRNVTVTELSGDPVFFNEYMERMMFE